MSGTEKATPIVLLPAALGRLVGALELLTASAVNIRLSTADETHRATQDIDLVTGDDSPTALEVLSRGREVAGEHTVVVNGVDVDVIETHAVTERDLNGLADDAKLFVAGHRWALDTATHVRITTAGVATRSVEVPVASPGGLIAAKSHAAGYPRPARRATKHGGDLYDIFRLIEVFDNRGDLRAELAQAPFKLGQLVAQVLRNEVLANPARAMRQMSPAASAVLNTERIIDVIAPFVGALD